MTDEQINAAIAKACGWKWVRSYQWTDSNGLAVFEWDIPDYCNDLNAMAEAEKKLGHILLYDYAAHISRRHEWEDLLTATARQRAEAFLRTLGKWEEVQA